MTKLRNTLIECYTTIVHGVSQANQKEMLAAYSNGIFEFIRMCTDSKFSLSDVYLNLT